MLSNLFIARTLLCAAIIALSAQGQPAKSSSTFKLGSRGSSILCGPGLVYRCGPKGCFCVPALKSDKPELR